MQERDDVHFTISRRRLIQGGAAIGALAIAGLGFNFFRGTSTSELNPTLTVPFETEQEKENTAIARKFLDAMFSTRTLPEALRLFDLLHPAVKAKIAPVSLLNAIRDYQLCSGLGLKKSGYEEARSSERDVTIVYFDFETAPCKGPDFEAVGIMVEMWQSGNGKFAPANFTWKDYKQR